MLKTPPNLVAAEIGSAEAALRLTIGALRRVVKVRCADAGVAISEETPK